MIKVVQRGGMSWEEFGYHFVAVPGLAVNQTERRGADWWTLTHLATGHSVGIIVGSKERATRLGEQLADLDWTPEKFPRSVAEAMRQRVREVAVRDGLLAWGVADGHGTVEFLDPALASLEIEARKQRERESVTT